MYCDAPLFLNVAGTYLSVLIKDFESYKNG